MIRLWCEWDIGQDSYIFTNEEKAREWLNKALKEDEYLSQEFESAEEILKEGLAGFDFLIVI